MSGLRRSKSVEELKDPENKNIRIGNKAHQALVKAQAISALQGEKKSFSKLIVEMFK